MDSLYTLIHHCDFLSRVLSWRLSRCIPLHEVESPGYPIQAAQPTLFANVSSGEDAISRLDSFHLHNSYDRVLR